MSERLTFVATCDLVALTRGRAFRTEEFAERRRAGVGWVPADLALTTFGDIATPNPFGSLGDLRLLPVEAARCTLPGHETRPPTDLVLADIVQPDGTPWDCCPRRALADAIRALADVHGLRLKVSFEQEFALEGLPGEASPFSIEAHRFAEPFGSRLVEVLHENGLEPETWLPEYGPNQYEITLAPTDPMTAADRAILTRTVVRDLAVAHGLHATFVPLLHPAAVGNGVHIHFSLWSRDGSPVTLDGATDDLSGPAQRFVAGVLSHASALVAWSAPSAISSLRLAPHRWSSAAAFLGRQNREAMVRLCPAAPPGVADPLRAAHLEFRACDASANPWLALAALIRAGIDGLGGALPAPVMVDGELDELDADEWERRHITRLPGALEEALRACETDPVASGWFAADLTATHLAVRRTELRILADATPEERCERYAGVL